MTADRPRAHPVSARPQPAAPAQPAADLSVTCLLCGAQMRPEHAHYRCPVCYWRDSCCDWPY